MKKDNQNYDPQNCGIYMWMCIPTGKCYIGQSTRLKHRKRDFYCFDKPYSGAYINNAREKYNRADDWEYEVLEYCTPEELDEKEQMYIYFYNSNMRDLGYNLTLGGDGIRGYKQSESTREKCMNSEYMLNHQRAVYQINYKGEIIGTYKSANEAERQTGFRHGNIASSCKGKYNQCNGFRWVYVDEYDENIDYSFDINKKNMPVIQYDLNGSFIREWDKISDVVKSLHISKSAICSHLNGYTPTCKGSLWCYKGESIQEKLEKKNICHYEMTEHGYRKRRTILQFDSEGNFIREWESAGEIAREWNKNNISTGINCACRNENRMAYGFYWKYKTYDEKQEYSSVKEARKKNKIPIYQIDIKTNEIIREWESAADAGLELSLHSTGITDCCKGRISQSQGYKWQYRDNPIRYVPKEKGKLNKIPIYQIDIETNEIIKEWESAADAGSALNTSSSSITACCKGRHLTAKGFKWRYKENPIPFRERITTSIQIIQIDKDTNEIIKEWESLTIAGKELGILSSSISSCLTGRFKTAGGFKWRYKNEPETTDK